MMRGIRRSLLSLLVALAMLCCGALTAAAAPVNPGDYLLPYGDSRVYAESELNWMNDAQLRLAINEFYARHGRIFQASDLRNYFSSKSWYRGTVSSSAFSESVFNAYEQKNIATLTAIQNRRKQGAAAQPGGTGGYSSPGGTPSASPAAPAGGDYILSASDTRYYTEAELSSLGDERLRLALNEIYARRGRTFQAADLQNYFNSKSWYRGTVSPAAFDEKVFNNYEKKNIQTITKIQNDRKAGKTSSGPAKSASSGARTGVSADYVLPEVNTRYYSEAELQALDDGALRLAINEIYARHGRIFQVSDLRNYFNSKSWYRGTVPGDRFDERVFNSYEKKNMETLVRIQNRRKRQ